MTRESNPDRRRFLSTAAWGDANGAPHPDPAAYAGKFSGRYDVDAF